MHVLLTGATGEVGRAVVARLLSEGHRVSILTRRPFLAEHLYGTTVELSEWHPFSEAWPHEAVNGADAVLHMLGVPFAGGPSRGRAALIAASRNATVDSLIAGIRHRVPRLVAVSIVQPLAAQPMTLDWEEKILAAQSKDFSVAVVRLGLVAAPSAPLSTLARLARQGFAPSLRGAMIPAITLSDAAAMLSGVLAAPSIEGIVNGVAPEALSGARLTALLKRLNRPGLLLPLPSPIAAMRLGDVLPLLQNRIPIAPERLLAAGARFSEPDPTDRFGQVLSQFGGRQTDDLTEPLVEARQH